MGIKVLKLGGHLINKENIASYCDVLKRSIEENKILHIVVGGGSFAREFIEAGRRLGLSEFLLDEIGIRISRVNALIIHSYLSKSFGNLIIAEELKDLLNFSKNGYSIICGGFFPSISTTTVACMIAELCEAKLYYATDVEGIYDKDPKKHKDAKLMKEISIDDLISIMSVQQDLRAGEYKLFDVHSLEILKRSKIEVRVFNGSNPENIIKALRNENIGTLIYHK